jgi:CRP-like cAMP-binding protein
MPLSRRRIITCGGRKEYKTGALFREGGEKMVDIELVKKFPLFKELDEGEAERFASCFYEKHYPAEAVICPQGGKGDELYLIKKGSVSIELPLHRYDSGCQAVSVLTAGMYFGELSFFDGKERSADVVAREDVQLLVLKKEDYDRLIKDNLREGCRIQQKIISSLIKIVREMNEAYSNSIFLG